MQRLTRAQLIQYYEFAPVEEIEELVANATSAAQICLAQQGITHPVLNPAPVVEDVPAVEVADGDPGQVGSGPFGATPIPDDFPGAKALQDGGITSLESLAQKSDEELLQIPGIGRASVVKIREALSAPATT